VPYFTYIIVCVFSDRNVLWCWWVDNALTSGLYSMSVLSEYWKNCSFSVFYKPALTDLVNNLCQLLASTFANMYFCCSGVNHFSSW